MAVDFELSKKWVIVGIALFTGILATTIILNNTHENTSLGTVANTIDIDNGDLKINWSRFESHDVELSDTLTITKSGVYHLTGSLTDQNIIVNVANGKVKLILDSVTIKNSTGPAIACYAADDLVIELVGESNLSDGKTYASNYDEDVTGAIYSKADLTFQGDGQLTLNANYQDGIVGKDDLKFNSGTYIITVADDGIRGKDSVYIMDGDFTISAKGDGIKSTNTDKAGKGFVLIEDGTINIKTSLEGIEGVNVIIDGGDISVAASDDGLNAGAAISINDGEVHVNASGDGIDSNGYLYFNGGLVTVDGPTNNGNGALDSGYGIFMNGGNVIAVGASGMAESLGSSSSVYNVSIYLTSYQPAGTEIEIKDSAGETIISHTSAKAFNHIAAGSIAFRQGETYNIYINGDKYDTFTVESITTTIGNSNMNPDSMNPGGNMPQGGMMQGNNRR